MTSSLLDEIALYTRRRYEGYLAHMGLDPRVFGAHLASYVLDYYRVTERPFPNRASNDLSIPPVQWGDVETKITPYTGVELWNPFSCQQGCPGRGDLNSVAESKHTEGEDQQQQQKMSPVTRTLDTAVLSMMGGFPPFLQENDCLPRI